MACPLLMLLSFAAFGATEVPPMDTANYFPFLDAYMADQPCALSYLAKDWPDRAAWAQQGRDKMRELLMYDPKPAPLNPQTLETVKKDGYTRYLVRFNVTADRTTDAFLLIPDGLKGPAPAVLALHCHSGYYYYGKEKAVETEHPSKVLQELIDKTYGGRCFGDELARRGFVVLAADAFYFGSQRIDPAQMYDDLTEHLQGLEPGSDQYIRSYHSIAGQHENIMAKGIFTSGATWPGILYQGDKISVDYLLTRPEVDPNRIGCIGLSIGGFRSAYMFGLDPRVKCGVVAGWMSTYRGILRNKLHSHTWMLYVPGLPAWLDLPDIVSLNAPQPLMVIDCLQDKLFTLDGMHDAEHKIAAVYEKMGAADRFTCRYYDEPHSLKIPAQNDAIAWLEQWLK